MVRYGNSHSDENGLGSASVVPQILCFAVSPLVSLTGMIVFLKLTQHMVSTGQ